MGASGGWELTPGKDQSGILLAPLFIVGGSFAGTASGIITSTVGAFGGVPGVLGLALVGAALGGYSGYVEPEIW